MKRIQNINIIIIINSSKLKLIRNYEEYKILNVKNKSVE